MISSLEHMDEQTLAWLVPEMARVCRGVVFVQVPSAMKTSDDHTGLKLVPWMPSWLASRYIAARGKRYRYLISGSGKWDVVYRNLRQIERSFESHFEPHLAPTDCSYPRCEPGDAVLDLRKTIRVGSRSFVLRIPLLHRRALRMMGAPVEFFYPYYNLIFHRR
jgi:hypothetical protein